MSTEHAFQPGFRLSGLDVVVLVVGALAAAGLAQIAGVWGLLVAFVLGHFFFFCNLIRMARSLELLWAGQFLLWSSGTLLMDTPGWPQTFLLAFAGTVVLTAIQLRKPSYHGVFWRRFNPGLPQWWAQNGGQAQGKPPRC